MLVFTYLATMHARPCTALEKLIFAIAHHIYRMHGILPASFDPTIGRYFALHCCYPLSTNYDCAIPPSEVANYLLCHDIAVTHPTYQQIVLPTYNKVVESIDRLLANYYPPTNAHEPFNRHQYSLDSQQLSRGWVIIDEQLCTTTPLIRTGRRKQLPPRRALKRLESPRPVYATNRLAMALCQE